MPLNDTIIPDVSLGENGRIYIGPANLAYKTGSVEVDPGKISTGCNRTGGFTTKSRTLKTCTINVKAQFMPEENPLVDPPLLFDGVNEAPTYFYPDEKNLPDFFYFLPKIFVNKISIEAEGEGVLTYSLNIENEGPFGTPNQPLD